MKAFSSFDQLLEVAREEKPKDGFSFVASNPPYSIESAGEAIAGVNIYHHFMEISKNLSKNISMIYPSRWMQSGQGEGLIEFRESELNSKNYSKFYDLSSSEEVFKDVAIGGGINYFLWRHLESPETEYYYDGQLSLRKTLLNGLPQMIRDPGAAKIVLKIASSKVLREITITRSPWGEKVRNEEKIVKLSDSIESKDAIVKVFYPSSSKVISRMVDKKSLTRSTEDWKVLVSGTAHAIGGSTYPRPDRIFVAGPDEIGTFSKMGSFTSKEEATNCLRYFKTNFSNFLFAIVTPTQSAGGRSYSLIPNVNFTTGEILDKPGTFLDFTKPETLDDQLAVIYNLRQDERNFMTKDLKPWKDKTSVTADM